MVVFREQVETNSILDTAHTTAALFRVGARYEQLDESRNLPFFIKPENTLARSQRRPRGTMLLPHDLFFPCVHDGSNIRNCDS
jgi:hypothetical protein